MPEVTKRVFTRILTEPAEKAGEIQPGFAAPPPPSGEGPQKRSYRSWAVVAGVAVLSIVAWTVISRRTRRATTEALPTESSPTVIVERRDFVRPLRLSGTVQAVHSRAIIAPAIAGQTSGELVITKLVPAGTRVRQGDLLAEFDRQNEIKNYLDNRAKYMDLLNQIAKQQATESAARARDETAIQTASDDMKRAQLDMQKLELLSAIDQEKTRQQLQQAQAASKELRETFKLRRQAAAADLRSLEIQRDQARDDMLRSQHNEERMAIHSPIDGIAVIHSMWKGGRVAQAEEGDQVRAGFGFMDVIDQSAMQVLAKADQTDLLRLHEGQPAQVRLDAYPESVFSATLEGLNPVGTPGQFSQTVRTFAAAFSVKGSDARLMPDLSAAVDVQVERLSNVVVVPKNCVFEDGSGAYVRVKRAMNFERQPVKLGPANDLEVVVESGLAPGEIVLRASRSAV